MRCRKDTKSFHVLTVLLFGNRECLHHWRSAYGYGAVKD